MTRTRVTPSWLAVRESADAAARAVGLVRDLRRDLPADQPLVIHDLACGSGAMMRWLAPQLPGPQYWVNYDLDVDLLAGVAAAPAPLAADGAPVAVDVRYRDVTRIGSTELADADLITCSALLDLFSAADLRRLVAASAATGRPVLFTLTVTGTVRLDPPHPLDAVIAAAFNAHQRRTLRGGALLGPDAVGTAAAMFADLGRPVVTRPSPWRLGPDDRDLVEEWLAGWLAAAEVQNPLLAGALDPYRQERAQQAATGRLQVVVEHEDLLVRSARGRVPANPTTPSCVFGRRSAGRKGHR